MGPDRIELCSRCRRDTLPQLSQPSWHREKHRASASEREPGPSPAAIKAKRRKDARKLRKQIRAKEILSAVRFFFEIKGVPQPKAAPSLVPTENCPECLKLQADRSAKSAAA